jgi:hypothetical protein
MQLRLPIPQCLVQIYDNVVHGQSDDADIDLNEMRHGNKRRHTCVARYA